MTHPPAPAGAARARRAVVAVGLTFALAAAGIAQPPPNKEANGKADALPVPPPAASPGSTLSLGECIAIGLERNPTVTAAVHSLHSAQAGQHALNNLPRYAQLLKKEIPVRQQQADCGVAIAEADVRKARQDVTYDVTRLYYTYVYASQQEKTANDVIVQMEVFYKVAEEIVKSGIRDAKIKVDQFTLYALRNRITDVKLLLIKAEVGRQQALDALREAMGVDDSLRFVPRDTELPLMGGTITKELVIRSALANRPELVQATVGVEAFRLEVCAQSKARGLQVPTLASGSDLHARQVPQAVRTDADYRPGAIAPEMPPGLVGRKDDRVARAWELSHRQGSVYEKALNLIRLEAAVAYLNWEATTRRRDEAKRRYEDSRKMVEDSRQIVNVKQDFELLFNNEALAGKAQAEYVEAVLEHLKAMAALERVTAGGIVPAFPGR
ncbi:MAG TPA: TolC family protein [Fimbriiglobus sp.]|nr:TolC family protein [Fimbriiglobus sp.]